MLDKLDPEQQARKLITMYSKFGRKVKKITWKLLGKCKLQLKIKGETGLYIKELITGDQGRTKPNVSEILNNKVKKIELDVIKIHGA